MFFLFAILSLSHRHHYTEAPQPTRTMDAASEAFHYFSQVFYLDLIATVCGFGSCLLFFVVLYYFWSVCRKKPANQENDQSIPPVQQQRTAPLIVREQQQKAPVRQSPVPAPSPYAAQPTSYQPYPSPYENQNIP